MKLTEVKYSDLLTIKKDEIETLVFDKDNQVLEEKCDVGIVFGGISMILHRIENAINLYENGKINRILVSGRIGFLNKDRKVPEAYKLEEYLLNRGIPKSDIITEDKSRNTKENIMYFLEILKKEYDLYHTNFALISSDFHIRRCMALVKSFLDSSNLYGSGVKDGITDIDNWNNSLYAKRLILTEALMLLYYAKTKQIEDLDIQTLSLKK